FKNDEERAQVQEIVNRVREDLTDFRVHVDWRDGLTPGFKFNDWELRGVPLRLEIGPRDVAAGTAGLARRDKPGKEGKRTVRLEGLPATVGEALDEVQRSLFERATAFQRANTHKPDDYAEFKQVVQDGWADSWWCGDAACEAEIKEETKATTRAIPLNQPGGEGVCIHCGKPAVERAIFGRSY
ncbi:MAG TPA: His/Gly/Thr/Pro-type tRNA ligase C-terminal domain-containing protein, partial [Anaerolineales bacterium]|nr:His/Gly/Thr/Pro-type tRNA ligase C-terminal domain-containing protein [Anaerolineales bacterium]